MNKIYYLSLGFLIVIYLVVTFIISFSSVSKSVTSNDFISLEKYIDNQKLEKTFNKDMKEFFFTNIDLMNKKISVNDGQVSFSGELTSDFFKKIFSKISLNVSQDFSKTKILLYFYFNSNEISSYLNKSVLNLGDYNFQKYELENSLEMVKIKKITNEIDTNVMESKKSPKIEKEKIYSDIILKLLKKIRSTDYFFFISPIHFKIKVYHQEIPFTVIFKFNGYKWIVQSIKIPFSELVDLQDLNFYK